MTPSNSFAPRDAGLGTRSARWNEKLTTNGASLFLQAGGANSTEKSSHRYMGNRCGTAPCLNTSSDTSTSSLVTGVHSPPRSYSSRLPGAMASTAGTGTGAFGYTRFLCHADQHAPGCWEVRRKLMLCLGTIDRTEPHPSEPPGGNPAGTSRRRSIARTRSACWSVVDDPAGHLTRTKLVIGSLVVE